MTVSQTQLPLKVEEFLATYPTLRPLIAEAEQTLRRTFPTAPVLLEMFYDPEFDDPPKLRLPPNELLERPPPNELLERPPPKELLERPKLELEGFPKLLAPPERRLEPNDPVELVGLPKRLALRPNELLPPNLEPDTLGKRASIVPVQFRFLEAWLEIRSARSCTSRTIACLSTVFS